MRHRVVNPLQLLAIEFRRTPKQRFGLQRSPAATSILCQPAIDRRTINAENISNHFRAFTILNTAHRTLTHRLQRGVIQSSRIICPHAQRESYSPRHVKKSPLTYVPINTVAEATAALGHVWTAPAVQEESDYQRSVRVRSCIRPLSAAVWP